VQLGHLGRIRNHQGSCDDMLSTAICNTVDGGSALVETNTCSLSAAQNGTAAASHTGYSTASSCGRHRCAKFDAHLVGRAPGGNGGSQAKLEDVPLAGALHGLRKARKKTNVCNATRAFASTVTIPVSPGLSTPDHAMGKGNDSHDGVNAIHVQMAGLREEIRTLRRELVAASMHQAGAINSLAQIVTGREAVLTAAASPWKGTPGDANDMSA